MAKIKLYGNAVNGDGKYLISPFDIAAPKADGKTAYTEDDKADDKNIVSYINSKVASLTSGIGAVKTGLQSGSFVEGTLSPAAGDSVETTLIITAKDGSTVKPKLSIGLPSADTIVTGASSYTNLVTEFKKLQTSYGTLNTTVGTINGTASTANSFRKGDADTLTEAKKYADEKVNNLGDVYHIEGTKSLTEIKALTDVKKGSVFNVSEAFTIDGKSYPEYTNLLFLVDAATVTWDSTKGFDGTQVDALGGVQDLSNYSLKANTVELVEVTVPYDTTLLSTNKTLASIKTKKAGNAFSNTVSINAKLPENLLQWNPSQAPIISMRSNDYNIYLENGIQRIGEDNLTVQPMSYNNIETTISFLLGEETMNHFRIPFAYICTKGEFGTTYANACTLPTAAPKLFGMVCPGAGINISDGVISCQTNEFVPGTGISIESSVMPNSMRFTIGLDGVKDISNTGDVTCIPLVKTNRGLGICVDNNNNGYISLYRNGANNLEINTSGLNNKFTSIESRITALETLLSLA